MKWYMAYMIAGLSIFAWFGSSQIDNQACFQKHHCCSRAVKEEAKILDIEPKSMQKEVKSKDGTLVLKCRYQYPQIRKVDDTNLKSMVRQVNQLIEEEALARYETKCKEAMEYAEEFIGQIHSGTGIKEWLPFTIEITYDVTYYKNQLLSFTYQEFEWLGGAHPSTILRGTIYDLKEGRIRKPEEFLTMSEKEMKVWIAAKMLENYQKNPEYYFKDEVEQLQSLEFDYGYYLNSEGLVFFFNPYEVAPYVTGIVKVPLRYEEHPEMFREPELFTK